MSSVIAPEYPLTDELFLLQEKIGKMIRVSDEISDNTFGSFYSDNYGNFAHAFGIDLYQILSALQLLPGQKIIDLGSGDGRWVFGASILGLSGEGFELNPKIHSVANIILEDLKKKKILNEKEIARISLHNADLMKADLTETDAIIFWQGSGAASSSVESKILSEAKQGTKVVIYGYLRGFEKLEPLDIELPCIRNQTKIFEVPI